MQHQPQGGRVVKVKTKEDKRRECTRRGRKERREGRGKRFKRGVGNEERVKR